MKNNDRVLELNSISHAYGKHLVVKQLSLTLEKGQIGCILGQSGCGKTTVLRTIAGFEPLLDGSILLNGKEVSRKGWSLRPSKRKVGMVFQDYALFPHLTILDNIAFGLSDMERSERLIRVNEMLNLVGLEKDQKKYPHEISGGQQQRVAIARALAPKPELLLMDEPFSNLDVTLRERLSMEVRDILKEYGATALFVTHNQHEAFAVADEVGVMSEGKMLQWDRAYNLYHEPKNIDVAGFVGEGVLIPGIMEKNNKVRTGLGVLPCEEYGEYKEGDNLKVLVRPEDIVHDDESPVVAEVLRRNFRGPNLLYILRLENGDKVQVLVSSHHEHKIGEKIGIRPDVFHVVLFPG